MKIVPSTLDPDIANELQEEAARRRSDHVRNQYRDEIIAALEAATGEAFTFGGWEDLSYSELEYGDTVPKLVNPNNNARCALVSETQRFTLDTGDMYDYLVGPDGRYLDIAALLKDSKLVVDSEMHEADAS